MNKSVNAQLEMLVRFLGEADETLKVGDILVSSWGYDQTNVDYYQVVAVSPKGMVSIREIASEVAGDNYGPSGESVVPVKDKFVGEVMKNKRPHHGRIRISSSQSAYKWDGKPNYRTASGWGH